MNYEDSVIESVGILVALIIMAMLLRRFNVIKEEHGAITARLITQYTLPALIFMALSMVKFDPAKLMIAVVMIVSQLSCALIALAVSNLLKLSRPRKGALILGSTFTSSAFLGYAVVKEVYSDNLEALSDAAIASELGVASIIFTVGIMVAIYFGNTDKGGKNDFREAFRFFRSPIFISLVLGILMSFTGIDFKTILGGAFHKFLSTIAAANTLLVTITIGIMLHFRDIRKVWFIVLLACVIKLVVQPLLSYGQSILFDFPALWHQIVVLESAMPTAALSAVFAKRYGCDAELTTILVFATFISSIFTMIMMIFLLG